MIKTCLIKIFGTWVASPYTYCCDWYLIDENKTKLNYHFIFFLAVTLCQAHQDTFQAWKNALTAFKTNKLFNSILTISLFIWETRLGSKFPDQSNELLTDWFTRKNLRRHSCIYNVNNYWHDSGLFNYWRDNSLLIWKCIFIAR